MYIPRLVIDLQNQARNASTKYTFRRVSFIRFICQMDICPSPTEVRASLYIYTVPNRSF